jgi:hypothetical protein
LLKNKKNLKKIKLKYETNKAKGGCNSLENKRPKIHKMQANKISTIFK